MFCLTARADILLSSATPHVAPGGNVEIKLTITNPSGEPMTVDLPSPLHLRFETETAVSIIDVTPDRSGEIVVPPNQFTTVTLTGSLPSGATGPATVTPTGLAGNVLALVLDPAAPSTEPVASDTSAHTPEPPKPEEEARLVDKPPPLAVSVYEPVYFIIGGDDGLNAKFQISFRYRLFDGEGSLASRLPWIDDLYLAYSQTSLWDLDELSKPFRDSSYKPRLFYADYDLGRLFDGRVRLGVETGLGHESNGKDGEESRSFNMVYVRPTLTIGDPEGFSIYLAPLIHNYISEDENPDIADYRGYVDWLFGAGSKGGLNFWTVLRQGTRSDYGSVEMNLSYPLSKLSRDLTGWVLLQYFGGHGESLLDYNRKLDSQLRLGIAVAL
jgi:phospholipase A1